MSEAQELKDGILCAMAEHMPDWEARELPDFDDKVVLMYTGTAPTDPRPSRFACPMIWCNMSRNGPRSYRLHFSGSFPQDEHGASMSAASWGVVPHGQSEPRAAVSSDRKPEAIARDVMRRVAKPYCELWFQAVTRKRKRVQDEEAVARVTQRLAEIVGAVPEGKTVSDRQNNVTNSFTVYPRDDVRPRIEAKVSWYDDASRVDLSLVSLDEHEARPVLELLTERYDLGKHGREKA